MRTCVATAATRRRAVSPGLEPAGPLVAEGAPSSSVTDTLRAASAAGETSAVTAAPSGVASSKGVRGTASAVVNGAMGVASAKGSSLQALQASISAAS